MEEKWRCDKHDQKEWNCTKDDEGYECHIKLHEIFKWNAEPIKITHILVPKETMVEVFEKNKFSDTHNS